MSEDPLHRVYIDSRPVDVARTATVIDAIEALDKNLADQVRRGDRTVTDSRGLPISIDEPINAGTILRTVKARTDNS